MDGVGTPIIERPRPLHNHDTPNPTHHPYTLKCEEPAKVARNLTRSFFEIGHKRCNFNDRISMSEICAWELRATLLGNQPDWKPTHETTYQHTRRRCDGRRMVRRARASFATRRRAKRDRQFSRADGPSDGRNNARAAAPVTGHDTRYGARHPIRRGALPTDRVQRTQSQEQTRNLRDDDRHNARAAAPVTGRDTRSEGVHCLRIGRSAPNHKNKRGICETNADTHKAPRARAPGASAHSDQPTLHVAPSRPSATVTSAAARRSRSSSARAQSLAARAAARSDSTARTSASNASCSAAAAPDAPAPMPAWPRGLGNTLTGTARQRAHARR